MTTLTERSVVCGCCGASVSHTFVGSTNTFGGSMDLDACPPEMKRSTMPTWVQVCPKCGFAGSDISTATDEIKTFVHSSQYQTLRIDTEYPELARAFISSAMIADKTQDHHAAGMLYLQAACSCDNVEGKSTKASLCRRKAVEHIQVAVDQNINNQDTDGSLETIIVDCLRRCGEFDKARELTTAQLKTRTKDEIRAILFYETRLINKSDTGCYRLSEALPNIRRKWYRRRQPRRLVFLASVIIAGLGASIIVDHLAAGSRWFLVNWRSMGIRW